MSRAIRRRGRTDEYSWVLRDWDCYPLQSVKFLDRHSTAGRRAIALFHSDKQATRNSSEPRWFRKHFNRKLRAFDDREVHRWFGNPDYEPIPRVRHRHSASWSWW